jgi:hypothetical protein
MCGCAYIGYPFWDLNGSKGITVRSRQIDRPKTVSLRCLDVCSPVAAAVADGYDVVVKSGLEGDCCATTRDAATQSLVHVAT